MNFSRFFFRILFISVFLLFFLCLFFKYFSCFFITKYLLFPYAIHPFDICTRAPILWKYIKIIFVLSFSFNIIIFSNNIFNFLFVKKHPNRPLISKKEKHIPNSDLNLYVGDSIDFKKSIYIPEKGLYQNILITGTIGSGKTSSAMYPFTKQLIEYKCFSAEKIGMLILDVKGNFYNQVLYYADLFNRKRDVVVIELGGFYKYNPLHKPNLKASVLANRLKNILTLFSPNCTESYWIDKAEQVLTECIKLCRIYNNRICNIPRAS